MIDIYFPRKQSITHLCQQSPVLVRLFISTTVDRPIRRTPGIKYIIKWTAILFMTIPLFTTKLNIYITKQYKTDIWNDVIWVRERVVTFWCSLMDLEHCSEHNAEPILGVHCLLDELVESKGGGCLVRLTLLLKRFCAEDVLLLVERRAEVS